MCVQTMDQEDAPFLLSDTASKTPTKTPLTFVNGLALVIGLQIGSGIFYAPSQVANHTPSPGAAILVWAIAGTLVWTGAASFIELGLAIPENGGVQEYLRAIHGEFSGFMFSWVYVAICKPCANAVVAMVFADHVVMAVAPDASLRVWELKLIAVTGLFVITIINCMGNVTGVKVANFFLVLKLSAVASIAVLGCFVATTGIWRGTVQSQVEWFGKDPDLQRQDLNSWAKVGEYITAAYGALFCYGGWETVSLIRRLFEYFGFGPLTGITVALGRFRCWRHGEPFTRLTSSNQYCNDGSYQWFCSVKCCTICSLTIPENQRENCRRSGLLPSILLPLL